MKTKTTKSCPRCGKAMPAKNVGQGVSLSRRGPVNICAPCGTHEAMLDANIMPRDALAYALEMNTKRVAGKKWRGLPWSWEPS